MNRTESGTLRVPGAQLPYEVRGFGPPLLLIAGGSGNSAGYAGLVDYLVGLYRVITYDRRGGGKRTWDATHAPASEDMSIERHADDARALLESLTSEPAYIFGSSAGGLVGLDLVTRSPDGVRCLLAHEPTVPGVLPAFDRSQERHLETFKREGALAAALELAAENAPIGEQPIEGTTLSPELAQAIAASAQPLFEHTVPAILQYQMDMAALVAVRNKIALGGGAVGRELATPVYQATVELAQRLGTDVIEFPGDHTGSISFPAEFAAQMHAVFEAW